MMRVTVIATERALTSIYMCILSLMRAVYIYNICVVYGPIYPLPYGARDGGSGIRVAVAVGGAPRRTRTH